jgi:hypothetical protein
MLPSNISNISAHSSDDGSVGSTLILNKKKRRRSIGPDSSDEGSVASSILILNKKKRKRSIGPDDDD